MGGISKHFSPNFKYTCNMSLIRDTNEYITRAIKKHGNKYDYSKTIYTGCYKKIVVTCPIHGDFEIKAASHLIGRGCRKCGVASRAEKRTLSYEAFIERATQKFGHTYSYNRFTYRGASQKMLIICPKHGEYWHTPLQHINQNGCPKCSGSGHKNTQDFIVDAQAIHGDRYDYSKVDYVTSKKKVCIVCNTTWRFLAKSNQSSKRYWMSQVWERGYGSSSEF